MCHFLSAVVMKKDWWCENRRIRILAGNFSEHISAEKIHNLRPGTYWELEWEDKVPRPQIRYVHGWDAVDLNRAIRLKWPTRTKLALHLLEGLNKKQLDKVGDKIFSSAVDHRESELIGALLERASNRSIWVKGVAHQIVRLCNVSMLKRFVKKAPKAFQCTKDLLHSAVCNGSLAGFKVLIDVGADVNQRDRVGKTPMMYVAERYLSRPMMLEMMRLLLKNGAKVDLRRRRNGVTALSVAANCGNLRAVKVLVMEGGADPNVKVNGAPLVDWVPVSHKRVRNWLLRNGAKSGDHKVVMYG